MTLYSTILFLHIASAIGLFIGYGLEWTISTLLRRATTVDQVRCWLRVYRVSPPLTGASLGVLILTGGYLASVIGAMKQGWMVASLVAILVAFSMGFTLNLPRIRALRDSLGSLGGTLPPEAAARLENAVLPTSVRVRTMLALGIVYLMTAKSSLAVSFVALGIAVLLGLVFSIPAWSPHETTQR
ncbi:MAG TPA: DUF2269 family protein [Candidatus Saccharimonadales bacterium]|nr:DUF2269 family protein [Candidatus Saccharimonadales bacterium]